MTQLAAWVGRDRALVAADTRISFPLAVAPDSAFGRQFARERAAIGDREVEGSKVLTLPHARLAIAHSGPASFHGSVFLMVQGQMGDDDIDRLDPKMLDILGAAWESLLKQQAAHYPEVPVERIRGQIVVLVGWSEQRERMAGVIYNQEREQGLWRRVPFAGFAEDEDPRGKRFAAPWDVAKCGPMPYASTPEAMEVMGRAQMRAFPSPGRGGRLLVTELTKNTVTTTVQCELEAALPRGQGLAPTADPMPSLPPAREPYGRHAVVFGRQ